jgi:hypothetical protein
MFKYLLRPSSAIAILAAISILPINCSAQRAPATPQATPVIKASATPGFIGTPWKLTIDSNGGMTLETGKDQTTSLRRLSRVEIAKLAALIEDVRFMQLESFSSQVTDQPRYMISVDFGNGVAHVVDVYGPRQFQSTPEGARFARLWNAIIQYLPRSLKRNSEIGL